MKKQLVVLFALLCLCMSPGVAASGYDMYLEMAGIPGEASFQGKGGFIALNGFKVGNVDARSGVITRPVISAQPSSFSAPKSTNLESIGGMGVSLTKEIDKATPLLMSASHSGRRFPSAQLVLCKAGDQSQVILNLVLSDVTMTHHSESGNQQTLTLNFEKFDWLRKP
jgi:type VI protein secretion system component Hcp